MADKIIWNDNRTMNFLANKYLAGYVYEPIPGSGNPIYRVRVQIDGASPKRTGCWDGLYYADCESEEEAKECLARLTEKLVRAGVIKEPKNTNGNRFDHVDLEEVHSE